MKKARKKKGLAMVALIAVLGLSGYAYADWGMGYGRYGMGMRGCGMGYGGQGYMGNLSEDEIRKLDQERAAFFNDTKDLRQDIYAKELELRGELASRNPDRTKVEKLRKEISDLAAQLDQKRTDHMAKVRKINPNTGRGFMGRGGMGYGMMGPGMMGGGMGPGMMGPGMMGRGYGSQYQQPQQKPLEEQNVKAMLENYLKSTRNPNLKLGEIEDKGNTFEAEIVTKKEGSLVDKIAVDRYTGWMRSVY